MSAIVPLNVTLELPATEFMDNDSGLFVRCPANRAWVPLTDYYSEKEGQLLPLVGRADYDEHAEHWVDAGDGQMKKMAKEDSVSWHEVVRVLEAPIDAPPEGGVLTMNVADGVGVGDKMG